jgi:hypothetical protein
MFSLAPTGRRQQCKTKEDLKIHVWIPLCDLLLSEMDHRFSATSYDMMRVIQAVMPTSPNFLNTTDLQPLLSHYAISVPEYELDCVKNFLLRKKEAGTTLTHVHDILENVSFEIFPAASRLYTLCLTLPVGSCTVERIFSVANRIKSRMRTSRHSNLTLLSFENAMAKQLDRNKILDIFKSSPRRLII